MTGLLYVLFLAFLIGYAVHEAINIVHIVRRRRRGRVIMRRMVALSEERVVLDRLVERFELMNEDEKRATVNLVVDWADRSAEVCRESRAWQRGAS